MEISIDRQNELAELCIVALKADGYSASLCDDNTGRVYVGRKLSSGHQRMGWVEVCEDGSINAKGMDRQQSTVRSICEKAIGK